MNDNLMSTPESLLIPLEASSMAAWSDTKRKDYCEIFKTRVKVARYLVIRTGEEIHERTKRRKFISSKHDRSVESPYQGGLLPPPPPPMTTPYPFEKNRRASSGPPS